MVKNVTDSDFENESQKEWIWCGSEGTEIADISCSEGSQTVSDSQSLLRICSLQNYENKFMKGENRSIKFKKTAIGCVIHFLRKNSPSPIENIIRHVKSKEHSLVTSANGKYKKDAFKIVDYVLSCYPKLFLLNDNFHCYLNENQAMNYEKKYNLAKATISEKTRLKYKEKAEKRMEKLARMQRIREQIEDDLRTGTNRPSILTKTYQILISDDKKAAEHIKMTIRSAYLSLKGVNP
ncbi:unnamed protein product [Blepharisma stoltei]|uniref:Uncharacterized protein n=1 Tax=Blepharisma stoltei TaxID=1481888 RepID=A0AAU9IL45_9CILI|nr:unnamed protein product [Blepharisma stoltei]